MPNLDQLIRSLERADRDLDRLIQEAEYRTAQAGLRWAVKFSSGDLSYADMRQMDHPYAARHGEFGLLDPGLINHHNDSFLLGWKDFQTGWHGNQLDTIIYNNSPIAPFLQYGTISRKTGKPIMVARPIDTYIVINIQDLRVKNLQLAINKAFGFIK